MSNERGRVRPERSESEALVSPCTPEDGASPLDTSGDDADLEQVTITLEEASRRCKIITRLLPTVDRSKVRTRWLDRACASLDELLAALRAGEDEILKASGYDVRGLTGPVISRKAPSPGLRRPRAGLQVDTSSVPSTIRLILAERATALTIAEILEGVRQHHPMVAYAGITNALHVMRKRGEVVRTSSGRPVRYTRSESRLTMAPKAPKVTR